MIISNATLKSVSTGFSTAFNEAFKSVDPLHDKIAMKTTSAGSDETYAWLGQLPSIREWVGARIVQNLTAQGYTIKNRLFESTVEVPRTSIEDDKIGVFGPLFSDMGRRAAEHPSRLIAELVASGTNALCYDGQSFFDIDHPVVLADGSVASVSNYQDGAGPTWYALDLSRAIKPFVYQERIPFRLVQKDREEDDNVFGLDAYLYGTRSRGNAGFGLWQLARASRAPLDTASFETARVAMSKLVGDNGQKLGVQCTHILVPPELEGDARRVLKTALVAGGESNPWVDAAEIIASPWL